MINPIYLEHTKDEVWLASLTYTILEKGFAILPQFLTPEAFEIFSSEARGLVGQKAEAVAGTSGYKMAHGPEFMSLFDGLYKARCKEEGKEYVQLKPEKQVVGFPYKDARDGKKTYETEYHYDGAYANATLAIQMPEEGGELIAFPNLRTGRNILVIKAFSRLLRHVPFLRRIVPHTIAKTVPNDLCLFFGDRTFHGVEPIKAGERLIMTVNNHW